MPTKAGSSKTTSRSVRTYVLDTSVLLADPGALRRFAEHEVVLPVVVITELEGKRHHPELGYFARTALRLLDELRITNGRLDEPVPVGDQVWTSSSATLAASWSRSPGTGRTARVGPGKWCVFTSCDGHLAVTRRSRVVRRRISRRDVPSALTVDDPSAVSPEAT